MKDYILPIGGGLAFCVLALSLGRLQDMTQQEFVCLGVLYLVDGASFWCAMAIRKRYQDKDDAGGAPMGVVLVPALATLACHGVVTAVWLRLIDIPDPSVVELKADIAGNLRVMGFSLGSGTVLAFVYVSMGIKAFSQGLSDLAMGMKTVKPPETDFSKARAVYLRGDTEGALQLCKDYFLEEPSTARALFEAHRILRKEGRLDEAADRLREILRHFPDEDGIWTQAAFDLAGLYENYFEDSKTAQYMLGEIVKRTPQTELGKLARVRLAAAWVNPLEKGTEQGSS